MFFPAGAVLYRVPLTWGENKLPWKLLHAALMLLALPRAFLGVRMEGEATVRLAAQVFVYA